MRILAVIDSFGFGGAETQLAEALRFLTEMRGHECLACSLLPHQTHEVGFVDRVHRVYLNKTSRLSLLRITGDLARLIRRYRPDVAYSRLPLANGLTRIATRLPGCRVRHVAGVDTVSEAFTAPYIRKHPGTLLFRGLERFADQIVCNSEGTARAVIASGYSAARIRVVPNGIDVERFRPPASRRPQERKQLVCIASLRPEKGVDRLIRLLVPLLRTDRAALTIVGDGPERATVERTIWNLRLGEGVQLLGTRDDVVPVLHNSDVYVSAATVEGFGIAVAEAAATGVPSVCMAAPGGLDEVVLDGITGYLIPKGQDVCFQETVHRLCSDTGLRERLGAAARDHIVRHFRIHDVAARLEHCLLTA